MIVADALSPIDLIPDFIPVLGLLLYDVILVPAGLALVAKMVPKEVLEECRKLAAEQEARVPKSATGMVIVLCIWILRVSYGSMKTRGPGVRIRRDCPSFWTMARTAGSGITKSEDCAQQEVKRCSETDY